MEAMQYKITKSNITDVNHMVSSTHMIIRWKSTTTSSTCFKVFEYISRNNTSITATTDLALHPPTDSLDRQWTTGSLPHMMFP